MNAPPPPSDRDLDTLLDRMAPAPLPSALLERLRSAAPSAPVPRTRRIPAIAWAGPMAAAAGIAIAVGISQPDDDSSRSGQGSGPPDPAPAPITASFFPEQDVQRCLLDFRDLGIVHDRLQRPVRLVSATWLDESTYGDPVGPPDLRESRLHHEIIPVLLPSY